MSASCPHCRRTVLPRSRFCPYCGILLARPLTAGDRLDGGNYIVERSLSKGGMGAVYLARDYRAFERLCVVKQMLEYYDSADPQERARAQQRFEDEGRVLATLSHPGVPRIYAFFIENGRYYIVMEYIKGENLESFVTREDASGALLAPARRLPREDVIRYTIQLCRILEYLHALPRPVIHQDIKPANIILEAHMGEVRLVDFGTARQTIPAAALSAEGRASVYGTEGYAPPEQYRGHPVPRSDVFSLAATIYHLLTDDDPRLHPFQFPRLKSLPREIAIALERALRIEPNQRSHALDLRQALETFATPARQLETFTFPGGAQIRSVGALPALCDEHWDAARAFLYNGDFQRWLRDLNRLDLVATANEAIKTYANHDSGLEHFLRQVDPGIARPLVETDQGSINVGSVAREAVILRQLTASNTTRGYTQAEVSSDASWLEVYPSSLHLWARASVKLNVSIHAQGLPLRKQQSAIVTIHLPDQEDLLIPVLVQVSIAREVWRLFRRAVSAAVPEAYRVVSGGMRRFQRIMSAIRRPFRRRSWLLGILWVILGIAVGLGLYYMPSGLVFRTPWYTLSHPESWVGYILPVILGPPALLLALYLLVLASLVAGGTLFGVFRGIWKSFTR